MTGWTLTVALMVLLSCTCNLQPAIAATEADRSDVQRIGLHNYRKTCFMNTVLQLLVRIEPFASQLTAGVFPMSSTFVQLQQLQLDLRRNEALGRVTFPEAQKNQLSSLISE